MDIEIIKQNIIDKVEEYHQQNWGALYPAGKPFQEWGVQAVAEKVVLPLMEENARLKQQIQAFQKSMIDKSPA